MRRVTVSVQDRHRHMNKADVPRLLLDLETRDQMPARMAVMTLAPFADLDRGLDFQPSRFAVLAR